MEILGVGPLEFILFLVLALVILGPEDMVGTARKIGQWVYRVVRSPTWRSIIETSQDLRDLPQKIVRDAGLEETMKEIKDTATEVKSDIDQTTRELATEMQAATTDVSREMQTAMQDANAGMKEAGAEAEAAMQSATAGLAGSENTIAPPEPAAPDETVPVPEGKPLRDPYEAQLESFAIGLGGKEIQFEQPEEATILPAPPAETTESAVPGAPAGEIQAEAPPKPTYVSGLETFAQALGVPTGESQKAEKPSLERQAPAESEPASTFAAIGIPVGLNLSGAEGVEARLKNRMDEMAKALEKLDAKIVSTPGQEDPATLSPQEPGNGSEPTAAPAPGSAEGLAPKLAPRKRAAKTTVPAAEAAESQAPKAIPRKRAAKSTPPAAEAVEGKIPQAAPRRRTAKSTPPAAEAVEGEAPRAALRARTSKKTTAPETAE